MKMGRKKEREIVRAFAAAGFSLVRAGLVLLDDCGILALP